MTDGREHLLPVRRKVDGKRIKEWCPHCGSHLTNATTPELRYLRLRANKDARCPTCGEWFAVPPLPEDALSTEPLLKSEAGNLNSEDRNSSEHQQGEL